MQKIQAAVKVKGSHHAEAFKVLKTKIKGGERKFDTTASRRNYNRSYFAQAAAFMYRLTKERKYARMAFETLVEVHQVSNHEKGLPEAGNGLARATVGLGFALAYDWCYDAWTEEQRSYIRKRIMVALDEWQEFSHPNVSGTLGSNWTAVCRGAELIMLLAVGEEKNRVDQYEKVKYQLKKHMKNAYDNLGVTQEGISYASYAGIFLLPAIYAAKSVGDKELYNQVKEIAWHKQVMYAGSFASAKGEKGQTGTKIHLMSGVGGPTINEDGWSSLLLNIVPENDLPYYLWWYNRHTGKKALPRDNLHLRYDYKRQGTIWALLYYPEDVESKDPTGIWPKAITGGRGQTFFRNRWKDSDDILATLIADGSHHSNAWSRSEAGQIGLIALETVFIGGPNKKRAPELYSQVLVNGKAGSEKLTGKRVFFEAFEDGGYAAIDGGKQYKNMGAERAFRHMMVQFGDEEKNEALITIADQLHASEAFNYIWNLNYGSHKGGWGLSVDTDKDDPVPTFTLQTADGARFHAWIFLPKQNKIRVDKSLKIVQNADSAEFLVVGWVGDKNPPELKLYEQGSNGIRIKIGEHTIAYDRAHNRLLKDRQAVDFRLKNKITKKTGTPE